MKVGDRVKFNSSAAWLVVRVTVKGEGVPKEIRLPLWIEEHSDNFVIRDLYAKNGARYITVQSKDGTIYWDIEEEYFSLAPKNKKHKYTKIFR